MNFRRIAGLAGLGFVLLVIVNVGLLAPDMPSIDDPTADVVAYFQDNAETLRSSAVAGQLSGVFVALFAAGLFSTLWRAERDSGRAWTVVALFGLVTAYAAYDADGGLFNTLLINFDTLGDNEATRTLFDHRMIAFASGSFNLGIYLLGVGAAVLTTRIWPAWLGWGALVGAAAGLIEGFGWGDRELFANFSTFGIVANVLALAFTVVASLTLIRDEETAPAPVA